VWDSLSGLARKAVVAILLEMRIVKSRAHTLSLDVAIAGWRLSIRTMRSSCCSAAQYSRFTSKATQMHQQCVDSWRRALHRTFTNEPLTLHDRLQLLANERRW